MLNGKLSAIRWVLGDEWGMLDTYAICNRQSPILPH
ncbi:hypothetical protein ABIE33_006402 [Ensifer sp. 4252]